MLISVIESGQLRRAIETQAIAVIVPIPWEMIKAGGTIIDKGLRTVAKIVFVDWTTKRRVIIKRICLELIVGFSFLETSIKNPQLIRTSMNAKLQEKISEISRDGRISDLYVEIMAMTIQIRKIINLSIFETLRGSLIGTWLLFQ